MSFSERLKYYNQIQTLRSHPLITYVTSIRPNSSANMASDVISLIIEQINAIPKNKTEVDFLIISNGGDPIVSSRIISLLRERFSKIHVLVPFVAYSAATVLALGADDIIMHPYSNLGPVDPQLTVIKNDKGQRTNSSFSSEDLRNYVDYIKDDIGITDQEQLMIAFTSLSNEVGALNIGKAKRSQQLMITLSERMLETHMKDHNKAASISKQLNSSYYHHGYAVSRSEAKKIGLTIKEPDEQLERLLWNIWMDFSSEMKCDVPFDPISEIMRDPSSMQKAMNFVPNIPGMPINPTNVPSITTINLIAAIESIDIQYTISNKHNILYWRDVSGNMIVNDTVSTEGWIKNVSNR